MNQGKALYELQQIDLTLIQHNKRLQAIAAQLADNAAVQSAQAAVNNAEATLKPLRTKLRDIELQVQSTRTKRESTEKRLYSGSVTNPKELNDMQNEIASLKKWLSELEDRTLEAMVEVEDAETVLAESQAVLEKVMNNVAAENKDLLYEKQRLESEVNKSQQRRMDAANNVDEANLKLYEALRPQKANHPIAHLNPDDTCSMCGIRQMGIVTKEIRRGEEIIYCRNCKRILVAL
jgi:uncharacterized protein